MTAYPAEWRGSALAGVLGSARPPRAAGLLGLEHEYRLTSGGLRLDFRQVLDGLPVAGRRIDPGDANAFRLPSGLVLTADEAEAEIASPPVHLSHGFTRRIEAWADRGRAALTDLLPGGVELEGYSTHLSVAMADGLNERACRLFAATFGPALMLLMERVDSYGVYLRPRPGRAEVCGDYVEGGLLRAVAAFVAGSMKLCAAALRGSRAARELLPAAVATRALPCVERYGLFLARGAFGQELLSAGRAAVLESPAGALSAQEHLRASWRAARKGIGGLALPEDLIMLDAMVSGDLPLPSEQRLARPSRDEASVSAAGPSAGAAGTPATVFSSVLTPRLRPGLRVEVAHLSWDFAVFTVEGVRRAYACVPRDRLSAFLRRLDAGALDGLLHEYLKTQPAGRLLAANADTRTAALWDAVVSPSLLVAAERNPDGSMPRAAGNGRAGKRQAAIAVAPRARPRPLRPLLAAGGIALVLLAILGLAVLAGGSDDSPPAARAETPAPASAIAAAPQFTPTLAPATSLPTSPLPAAAPPTGAPPTAAPTPVPATSVPPTAPPTAVPPTEAPDLLVGVGGISASFSQPTTTYAVMNSKPGLTFAWSGPDCGTVIGASAPVFIWMHPHPPCDPTTDHAHVTIRVTVSDGVHTMVCTYQGAASGVGPQCVRQ